MEQLGPHVELQMLWASQDLNPALIMYNYMIDYYVVERYVIDPYMM